MNTTSKIVYGIFTEKDFSQLSDEKQQLIKHLYKDSAKRIQALDLTKEWRLAKRATLRYLNSEDINLTLVSKRNPRKIIHIYVDEIFIDHFTRIRTPELNLIHHIQNDIRQLYDQPLSLT